MTRAYTPVAAGCGKFNNHYAVREEGTRRLLCADLKLSWDQADRLCDVFEGVRQRSLNLQPPLPETRAA